MEHIYNTWDTFRAGIHLKEIKIMHVVYIVVDIILNYRMTGLTQKLYAGASTTCTNNYVYFIFVIYFIRDNNVRYSAWGGTNYSRAVLKNRWQSFVWKHMRQDCNTRKYGHKVPAYRYIWSRYTESDSLKTPHYNFWCRHLR